MRLYGSFRHDLARCIYGCCGGKLIAFKNNKAARRAAKKRARRALKVS